MVIDVTSSSLNYLIIEGVRTPGTIVAIDGLEAPYKWDSFPGYGVNGATNIFKGRDIAHPVVTFQLFQFPDDMIAWDAIIQLLKPPTVIAPFIVDVSHPLFAASNIKSFGIEKITFPMPDAQKRWFAKIHFIESRPRTFAAAKPKGSIPSPSVAPPTVQSQLDKDLIAAQKANEAAKARNRL